MTEAAQYAAWWAQQGHRVMPLGRGSKVPVSAHGSKDAQADPDWVVHVSEGHGGAENWGLVLDRLLVVDVDSYKDGADATWAGCLSIAGVGQPTTLTQRSARGGHHYIYLLPADADTNRMAVSLGPGVDLKRGQNAYIVLAGSVFEGGTYEEINEGTVEVAPAWLVEMAYERKHAKVTVGTDGQTIVEKTAPTKSGHGEMGGLAGLLALPADSPERGNVWLTKVAGYEAKDTPYHDKYEARMRSHNNGCSDPHDEETFQKTINSVWQTEQRKREGRTEAPASVSDCTPRNGWVVAKNGTLQTKIQWSEGKGDDKQTLYGVKEMTDFTVECRGIVYDENRRRMYDLVITPQHDPENPVETTVDGETFGDGRAIGKWLGSFGCHIWTPQAISEDMPVLARLQKFIDSQGAPVAQVVDHLGWHGPSEAFITHIGMITDIGEVGFANVRPNPKLKGSNRAPFIYGFDRDDREAVAVLQFVMTTQVPQMAAVAGAWWAGCFLKANLMDARSVSLFPLLGLEAPSESGKTRGTMGLLSQMNGSTAGPQKRTVPATRDALSGTRAGIVWTDDLNEISETLKELIRQTTTENTVSKMGNDNTTTREFKLLAPLVISGEALGWENQKALLDRSVILDVPSPTDRMSNINPGRPQWDDITDLFGRYPEGLHVLAGRYLRIALSQRAQYLRAVSECKRSGGRRSEKYAIMLASARLLDAMLAGAGTGQEEPEAVAQAWEGLGWASVHVGAWVAQDDAKTNDQDNALTLELMPWAIGSYQEATEPGIERRFGDGKEWCPVWKDTEEQCLWFSPQLLAEAWERHRRGQIDERVHTAPALEAQARRLGLGGAAGDARKQFRLDGRGTARKVFWKVEGDLARELLDRARGGAPGSTVGSTAEDWTQETL